MVELLCITKNKMKVFYDNINSHASTHFADTPNLRELVIEVLSSSNIHEDDLSLDVDMKRIIGTTDVVAIESTDKIVYAIRKNRPEQGYVPFVKFRLGQPDSHISIALMKGRNSSFDLSSAWIGTWDDPPFPQEPHATLESRKYWDTHAFIWGSQDIESGTEILKKPWQRQWSKQSSKRLLVVPLMCR